MGTLNLLVAALNFFIAGIQFATWLDNRNHTAIAWTVTNFVVGVFCMVSGVGAIVRSVSGS